MTTIPAYVTEEIQQLEEQISTLAYCVKELQTEPLDRI